MANDKHLETKDDTELLAAIKADWQSDIEACDREIARWTKLLAAVQERKAAIEARLAKSTG